ncbi:MAG: ATP-binding protein [Actinobacteria bacterium]|nr:MAG: ATP-binding protein [Actinomycetota bacterium]
MNRLYVRSVNSNIRKRLEEKRQFIQVVAGPRQVGKTTAVTQVLKSLKMSYHYASADKASFESQGWIEEQWEIARLACANNKAALLVLDEVQKISNWSNIVKALWDEDTLKGINLKVVILGSSPLLMQSGLSESLAGRFEIIPVTHWFYSECKDYFGWDLESYIYYGGYPGAAKLSNDRERWADYIANSLIETSISRDILLMTRIDKPALLRQLFYLGCKYSGQIVSYQKLTGQLTDAKNTTTLANYLQLLSGAGLLTGLSKYSGSDIRKRASSPKLQVFNTGLITSQKNLSLNEIKKDKTFWGRLVESAVGAHLLNHSLIGRFNVYYWRKQSYEVDFIVQKGQKIVAIEVKSGADPGNTKGMAVFSREYSPDKRLFIGNEGLSLEDFFVTNPLDFFD